jgi:hypothetical protein
MRMILILVLTGALGLLGCGNDDNGGGGTGGSDAAATFCDDFQATCNYDDYDFENRADCLDFYNTEDAERVDCVELHLGYAMDYAPGSDDRILHCGHATGRTPCN